MTKGLVYILKTAWELRELTGDEVMMMLQICGLAETRDGCFATDQWFADHGPGGLKTVQRRLASLIENKWIATNGKRGTHRRIEPLELPPKHSKTYAKMNPKAEKKSKPVLDKNDQCKEPVTGQKCPIGKAQLDKNVQYNRTKMSNAIYTKVKTKENLLSEAGASDTGAPVLKLGKTKAQTPESSTATPDDSKRAARLEKAILEAGPKLPRPYPTRPLKVRQWASAFRKLREVDQISPERIDSALKGYCRYITHERAPQAWSGESFRAKFGAIEQFVRIRKQETPETKSDAALNPLTKEVLGWAWPVPLSEPELSESLDAAKEFGDTVRRTIREGRSKNALTNAFLDYVSENLPTKFALGWHQWILNAVQKWSEWSGSLARYRPAATCPLFVKRVRKLSQEFTLSEEAGKRFLKMFGDKA